MARMTLEKGLSVDRKKALLQMCADGEPLAHMIYDSSLLQREIRELVRFRSNVLEPVPEELDPKEELEIVRSPEWAIPDTHSGPKDGVLLAVRHPGMGWVGLMLEPDRARAIGEALLSRTR